MFSVDISRHRKPSLQDILSIAAGSSQQLSEVLVLRHVLIAELEPLGNRLALVDEYVKERVHEENAVVEDGRRVEQDGLGRPVERVRVEDGLDHDERLRELFDKQIVTVVGCLVRAVVEHLKELRAPQVEHELRVEREVLG